MRAFRTADGSVVFHEKARFKIEGELTLPCGQCIGCRLERSRQWAVRCVHESKMHKFNCFVTLTYDDIHLPDNRSLDYKHFQAFMKRLRRRFSGVPIRFFMCGEYGESTSRPHYHALLFGIDFADKKHWRKSGSGSALFTSDVLSRLWPHGSAYIGDVTFESAAYCARYVLKKHTGSNSTLPYTNPDTGEIRQKEFCHMSLKPGIGRPWLDRFRADVYPHDHVIVRGNPCKPPKYYDRVLDKSDPLLLDDIRARRELDAYAFRADNVPDRLMVKEQVTLARLRSLPRDLE